MSVTATPSDTHARPVPPGSRRWTVRLITLVGAVGAAVAGWLFWNLVLDVRTVSPDMGAGSFPITLLGCIVVVLVSGGLGLAVTALVERVAPRPRTAWVVVAALTLLVSLAGPLTGAGVSTVARLALVSLHLLVGAVLLLGIASTLPSRRR